jgi:hypothetical protein
LRDDGIGAMRRRLIAPYDATSQFDRLTINGEA